MNKNLEIFRDIGVKTFSFWNNNRISISVKVYYEKEIEIPEILPSRNKKDLSQLLKNYSQIKLVSGDSFITYASAIGKVLMIKN